MCVTYFALGAFPSLRLLLAFNRDEFIARPTTPAHFWPDHPDLLAGRDLLGRGTWLGITRSGRLAFLTNFREKRAPLPAPHQAAPVQTRGHLTTDFLVGSERPLAYLQGLDVMHFAGFNLVVGDLVTGELAYLSSGKDPTSSEPACAPRMLLPRTVYGLSNALLMQWTKVIAGVQHLKQIMAGAVEGQVPWESLFNELLCERTHVEALRPPNGAEATFDDEKFGLAYICSSRFIDPVMTPEGLYGTRAQTVLAVWEDGRAELRERCLDPESQQWGEQANYTLQMPVLQPLTNLAAM